MAQYTVPGFPGMLLSPRSRKVGSGRFAVCTHCKVGMKASQANSKKPPKFATANGFAIGTFPPWIPYASPSHAEHKCSKWRCLPSLLLDFVWIKIYSKRRQQKSTKNYSCCHVPFCLECGLPLPLLSLVLHWLTLLCLKTIADLPFLMTSGIF